MALIPEINYCPLFIGLLTIISCSEDSSEPEVMITTTNLIELDYAVDYANDNKASDLVVQYRVRDAADLSDLWLFISPESDFAKLNSRTLAQLSGDRYQSIDVSETPKEVRLKGSLLDTEGGQIRNETKYILGFATVKADVISKELLVHSFEMKDQHYLTGRYVGVWKDEYYSDVELSMEISMVGSLLRGPVFWTNKFVSHWGDDDDGKISFVANGDQLLEVQLDEMQSGIMNGCTGSWTGTGNVVDLATIIFQLEGENCLYSTSNAQVNFKRFK